MRNTSLMMFKDFIVQLVVILLLAPVALAQDNDVPVLTDKFLATLMELDPKAPASDDIEFDFKKIAFYNAEGQLLSEEAKKEYRSNPEYTLGRMFADADKVVRVVIYRKSTDLEKAQKASFQKSLDAMNPDYFKGEKIKPFKVTDMQGNTYSNKDLKGKVVVFNFWFIGCVPCVEEMPVLNKLVEKYKDQDVVFLAVTYDKKSEVSTFLKNHEFDYQIIPENTQFAIDYSLMAYPDHMIVDKKSVIQYKGNISSDRLFNYFSQYIDLCLAAQ